MMLLMQLKTAAVAVAKDVVTDATSIDIVAVVAVASV